MGMAALRNASLLLLFLVFHLVPARAEEGALNTAAPGIEQLIKAGKLIDAEALGARSAKTLAAVPSALPAADTARLATPLSDLAYALAANPNGPHPPLSLQHT